MTPAELIQRLGELERSVLGCIYCRPDIATRAASAAGLRTEHFIIDGGAARLYAAACLLPEADPAKPLRLARRAMEADGLLDEGRDFAAWNDAELAALPSRYWPGNLAGELPEQLRDYITKHAARLAGLLVEAAEAVRAARAAHRDYARHLAAAERALAAAWK